MNTYTIGIMVLLDFYKLILINRFLFWVPDTFYSLTKFKLLFLRYKRLKPESSIGSILKVQTKKAKIPFH